MFNWSENDCFSSKFGVNSSISKLWNLLTHFDKKDMGFFKKEQNLVLLFENV